MIRYRVDSQNKRMDPSTWEGSIDYIYDKGFYECGVTSRGSTFRLMIGRHKDGNFLCIPNWSVGIELSKLKDRFWNYERLTQYGKMGKVDAHSVADALVALDKYIKL